MVMFNKMFGSKKANRLEIVIFKSNSGTTSSHNSNKNQGCARKSSEEVVCSSCSTTGCMGCEVWDTTKEIPIFRDHEVINGEIVLSPPKTGINCRSIRVTFYGELTTNKRKENIVFRREARDLLGRDHVTTRSRYKFSFAGETMTPYETYSGNHLHVRYYLQAAVLKRLGTKLTAVQEVVVERPSYLPEVTRAFKMEAGNERSLQVEMECNKWRYHQNDVIKGTLRFVRADFGIKSVELQIVLKEKELDHGKEKTLSELIILKQEVLDGSPIDNGFIPIRAFLAPLDICPTIKNVEDKFSVRYYIKLVITDDTDHVFFKSQELTIYRKSNIQTVVCKRRIPSMETRNLRKSF